MPVLYYLAGLTCTEETFAIKAHAQAAAAELGLMLVAPDTSPREPRLPGDADNWDFGQGAGFYLDATQAPWREQLPDVQLRDRRAAGADRREPAGAHGASGIFGHSMGGHGALTCALRNPQQYRSVSAFAPIARRCTVPGGETPSRATSGRTRNLAPV